MSYELPMHAAKLRFLTDSEARKSHVQQAQKEAVDRSFDRKKAAISIARLLKDEKVPERRISTVETGLWGLAIRHSDILATGFVLAEEQYQSPLRFRDKKAFAVDVRGLLLDVPSGNVFSYGASRIPYVLINDAGNRVDAWGNSSRARVDNVHLGCDYVKRVDFVGDPREVDKQVASVAAPLDIDDLFAGLVYRKELTVHDIMPNALSE